MFFKGGPARKTSVHVLVRISALTLRPTAPQNGNTFHARRPRVSKVFASTLEGRRTRYKVFSLYPHQPSRHARRCRFKRDRMLPTVQIYRHLMMMAEASVTRTASCSLHVCTYLGGDDVE